MLTDPWFYAAALPAILITGISKGGFAGGLGIVAVPLVSLAVPPLQAIGILLPILIVMDGVGLWAYRGKWDAGSVAILLPASLAGVGLGWLLADYLSENLIRLLVGLIALAFAVDYWLGRRSGASAAAERPARPQDWRKGGFWGAVAGLTSFVAHAGAPPAQVYMLPRRLDKTIYVGTMVVVFASINAAKVVPYGSLGLLDRTNLATAAVLLPLAPLGMYLGIWLHSRVNQALFYRLCYTLVVIAGLHLIATGLGFHLV